MNFKEVEKMIFKDEKGKYSLSVGKKENDEWNNKSLKVVFNKGVELENKEVIKIKEAKLDFYDWEYDGKKGTTWYIRVFDFDKSGDKKQDQTNIYKDFGKEIQESELPF